MELDEPVLRAARLLRHLSVSQPVDERARLFLRDKGLSNAQIELALSLAADGARAPRPPPTPREPRHAQLATGLAASSSLVSAARRHSGLARLLRALLVAFVAGFGAFALCRLALARWPQWRTMLQLARARGRRALEASVLTDAAGAPSICTQPGDTSAEQAAGAPSRPSERAVDAAAPPARRPAPLSLAELERELDSIERVERERQLTAQPSTHPSPSALGDPADGGARALRALRVYARNGLGGAARISTHSLQFAHVQSEPLDRLLHALGFREDADGVSLVFAPADEAEARTFLHAALERIEARLAARASSGVGKRRASAAAASSPVASDLAREPNSVAAERTP